MLRSPMQRGRSKCTGGILILQMFNSPLSMDHHHRLYNPRPRLKPFPCETFINVKLCLIWLLTRKLNSLFSRYLSDPSCAAWWTSQLGSLWSPSYCGLTTNSRGIMDSSCNILLLLHTTSTSTSTIFLHPLVNIAYPIPVRQRHHGAPSSRTRQLLILDHL